MNIDDVLAERGSRYGDFATHAQITQDLKAVMANSRNWGLLAPDQREALEMVAHKIGRILNGDPTYLDSWDDIIGYVKLVVDRMRAEPVPQAGTGDPRAEHDLAQQRAGNGIVY